MRFFFVQSCKGQALRSIISTKERGEHLAVTKQQQCGSDLTSVHGNFSYPVLLLTDVTP